MKKLNLPCLFLFLSILELSPAQPNIRSKDDKTYYFEPAKIKRDPFQPLSDAGNNKSLLTAFDVTRFQLVAVLTGLGSSRAMIMLPNKETEIVRVGDKLGKNSGKVHRINDSEVVVKESYKDYQGKMRSYFTSLVIAD
ncbi:MAG: pilus assembly protein PilP [Bdellovibrionota bacterium]